MEALALHAVFMALVVGIVAAGIEDGIEKATKLMVPSIVVILAALAVFASRSPARRRATLLPLAGLRHAGGERDAVEVVVELETGRFSPSRWGWQP